MSIPQDNNGILRNLDLCFLDIETTGSTFGLHEIIDIAAIRTNPDGTDIHQIFQYKIAPQHPDRLSERAREITGYSNAAWRDARKSDHVFWMEFSDFAQGCVPVCYNPSFDRSFITLTAARVEVNDLGLDYHWIGTESLAWPLYREGAIAKLSLATLCEYWGILPEPLVHTALNGAQACRCVYLALMSHLGVSSHELGTHETKVSHEHSPPQESGVKRFQH